MTRAVFALALMAAAPLQAQADTSRLIAVGSSISGHLTREDARTADGTYAQAWYLTGTAGHLVTVDLASKDFDAFLMVRSAGLDSIAGPLQDDDSGGHCNARLSFRLPPSGECTIVVTTSNPNTVGDFTLAVRSGAIPASLAPCHG